MLVAWNWLAGGTASSNTDGSITSQLFQLILQVDLVLCLIQEQALMLLLVMD
jgi:hypothetical protein